MFMILSYENGLRTDAVLLAAGSNRMRVAIRDSQDATELRRFKDQWMTEDGDAVDIDALQTGVGTESAGARVCGHAA